MTVTLPRPTPSHTTESSFRSVVEQSFLGELSYRGVLERFLSLQKQRFVRSLEDTLPKQWAIPCITCTALLMILCDFVFYRYSPLDSVLARKLRETRGVFLRSLREDFDARSDPFYTTLFPQSGQRTKLRRLFSSLTPYTDRWFEQVNAILQKDVKKDPLIARLDLFSLDSVNIAIDDGLRTQFSFSRGVRPALDMILRLDQTYPKIVRDLNAIILRASREEYLFVVLLNESTALNSESIRVIVKKLLSRMEERGGGGTSSTRNVRVTLPGVNIVTTLSRTDLTSISPWMPEELQPNLQVQFSVSVGSVIGSAETDRERFRVQSTDVVDHWIANYGSYFILWNELHRTIRMIAFHE